MQDLPQNLKLISEIKSRLASEPAKILNLMISGSHLYGFESKDSDIDYRGTYLLSSNKILGLHKPKEVIILNSLGDVVLFEIGKEVNLALKGNCNSLEHLNAKQIITTAEFLSLKNLINNSFGKNGIYNSYKGMATFNYKKFVLTERNTAKKYLYVFRGLMAGIYALQTGKIQPNINELNTYFKLKEVKQLIELKKEGREHESLPIEIDKGNIEEKINWLFNKIDEAYIKSKIPERTDIEQIESVNKQLVEIRKSFLD